MTTRTRLAPTLQILLPMAPDGWFDIAYCVTMDGHLACLRATSDVPAALSRRDEIQNQFQGKVPEDVAAELRAPLFPADTRAQIHIIGETARRQPIEFQLEYPFPVFDRLLDGRWVIAHPRCEIGEKNARLLDKNGTVLARWHLGDGIEHLQCDANGKIWVGYFDEGIFGTSSNPEVTPFGVSGLVRFEENGKIDWSYQPPEPDGPWIADCYALNVGESGVWACVYSDFPILRIQPEGSVDVWLNDIAGAGAIAVDNDYVALLGGYDDESNRLALLRLDDVRAELISTFDLDLAGHDVRSAQLVAARGNTLHVVTNRTWFRLSVAELLQHHLSD